MGQAAHVYDGVVRDVRGYPEDEDRKNNVPRRFAELADRAIGQFVEKGAVDGLRPAPCGFINWPGLGQEGV
eukprot:2049157-Alexandrium_andersonii.AAC.1